jgi:ribonucleotide monophosphatase NagD (HAD superfamily)
MLHENKKLAILSNTSSPSQAALQRLSKYGLKGDMFTGGLVSSGEECAKYVKEMYCSGSSGTDAKALWFTWNESDKQAPFDFLRCCETEHKHIDIVESVSKADFILLHGSEVLRRCRELSLDSASDRVRDLNFIYNQDFSVIDPILEEALQRKLPMVCANPDMVVALQGDIVGNMPGQIAQRYEQIGGKVTHFGKPNPRHFIACLRNLGLSTDNTEHFTGVAHVGDSLEHDIQGANSAGLDSIFVLGGIHAVELGLAPTRSDGCGFTLVEGEHEQRSVTSNYLYITKHDLRLKLNQFFDKRGIYPTHVVPSLSL